MRANGRDTGDDHEFWTIFFTGPTRRQIEVLAIIIYEKKRLVFKSMLARECFCRQQNKQKKWIPVVLNREKMVIFYHFFKTLDGTLDLCMQQNDIAVLRRCQRFFLLGLLFYDDASDFFFQHCSFTTVPGQLFSLFDVTHEFPYW